MTYLCNMKEKNHYLNLFFLACYALQVDDLTVIWDHVDHHHWLTRKHLVIYKIINNNHNIINNQYTSIFFVVCAVLWTCTFLLKGISGNPSIHLWLLNIFITNIIPYSLSLSREKIPVKNNNIYFIILSFFLLCCFSSFPIKNHQKMSANERLSSFLSFLKKSNLLFSIHYL